MNAMKSRIISQLSKVALGCEPEYARLRLLRKLFVVALFPVLPVVAVAGLPFWP